MLLICSRHYIFALQYLSQYLWRNKKKKKSILPCAFIFQLNVMMSVGNMGSRHGKNCSLSSKMVKLCYELIRSKHHFTSNKFSCINYESLFHHGIYTSVYFFYLFVYYFSMNELGDWAMKYQLITNEMDLLTYYKLIVLIYGCLNVHNSFLIL